MYWICFGESPGGMLKAARHSLAPELPAGHIVPLLDDLSQGDLAALDDADARGDILCPWAVGMGDAPGQRDEYLRRHFQTSLPMLGQVDEAVIWYGDNARERCGMLYAVSRLAARGVPIWVVHADSMPAEAQKEPDWLSGKDCGMGVIGVVKNNGKPLRRPQWYLRWRVRRHLRRTYRRGRKTGHGTAYFASTGELSPGDAGYFYEKRRLLSPEECAALAAEWETLCRENAPMRVLEDGRLCSAPEDYYDGLILSEVPVDDVCAASVIGCVIGRHQLHISDMLIYKRLRSLIAQGKVGVVADGETYRDLVIRRGG